ASVDIKDNLTESQVKPMLRKLLEDRFKLRLHTTTREVPGYALVPGKDGPKIKEVSAEGYDPDNFKMGRSELSGRFSMQDFARFIAGKVGVVGVDQTGLKGIYEVKAQWQQPAGIPDSPADAADDRRAAVFEAVENQLGLKFKRQRVPVQVLVID